MLQREREREKEENAPKGQKQKALKGQEAERGALKGQEYKQRSCPWSRFGQRSSGKMSIKRSLQSCLDRDLMYVPAERC